MNTNHLCQYIFFFLVLHHVSGLRHESNMSIFITCITTLRGIFRRHVNHIDKILLLAVQYLRLNYFCWIILSLDYFSFFLFNLISIVLLEKTYLKYFFTWIPLHYGITADVHYVVWPTSDIRLFYSVFAFRENTFAKDVREIERGRDFADGMWFAVGAEGETIYDGS